MVLQLAKPEAEYAKYKELRKEGVVALQQWMEKQPHLPKISELEVIQFFQSCYFKTEATKNTIETYFTLKTHWPEYFADRDPNLPQLKEAMEVNMVDVMQKRTPEGYIIVLSALLDYDPSKFSFYPYLKLYDILGNLWLAENGTAEGAVFVIDMAHSTFAHLSSFTIIGFKNLFCYLQEGLPLRLKSMHFINTGAVMDKLMLLMKPFIKKDLLEVLHTHPKVDENFFKFVPKECLPSDYGGSAPSLTELNAKMKKKLLDCSDYLIERSKVTTDESKRIEKRNESTQEYGLDGSFKKLELD